jgi:hypothetical protein
MMFVLLSKLQFQYRRCFDLGLPRLSNISRVLCSFAHYRLQYSNYQNGMGVPECNLEGNGSQT